MSTVPASSSIGSFRVRFLYVMLGRKLQLHGGGLSKRSFIHMRDVSDATWRIAKSAPAGETYHISTNQIVTVRELVTTIVAKLGSKIRGLRRDCRRTPGQGRRLYARQHQAARTPRLAG